VTPRALIAPARLAGSGLLRTQSDARLVDLVRAGHDRAFEAIVHRYRRALLRHCRKLLPPGPAEDSVQQAFLHALEAIRADERELALGPWLHRIAQNAAIDSMRRIDSHWEELDERMDGVEPTHAAAERRARFRSVVAGLGALPERQRRALVLRELEGRSYEEIAEELGGSADAVRQLLNRARNAMRSGATAVVPTTLVGRLANSPAGVRMAEMGDPSGTSALFAKGASAVAASALALLAVSGSADHGRAPLADARANPPAQESRAAGGHAPGAALPDRAERRDVSARADGQRGPDRGATGPSAAIWGKRHQQGDEPGSGPRRAAGPEGTREAGDDTPPGRFSKGHAPAAAPQLDGDDDGSDDDSPAGRGHAAAIGDEGSGDDDGSGGDDGAGAPVAATVAPEGDDGADDDGADDDDAAPTPSGAPVAGAEVDAAGDDDDG
jgi:RNA polymerase sigma factor (sigma-70 family)